MLDVEAALARAHAKVGNISEEYAEIISKNADTDKVKIERVKQIEKEIRHDLMAVVKAMAEASGKAGKYVHLGATSSDIVDTATALQLKEAAAILKKDLMKLRENFVSLAKKHEDTVMMGRTHGQSAVPMTFGLKMAVYGLEVHRHLKRLNECEKRILVGKMSGAVGTGAAFGPHALKIQKNVMKDLGLGVEEASTQIIGRDRYAEFVCLLANIASSIEKFATEVRNLQRSEIDEVAEAFDTKKWVGSSTMAHKKNPEVCENVCGLARIIRSFATPALENMILWHERDLTNSSAERFIIPHICILTDDIIVKTADVFDNLEVNKKKMRENIEKTKGAIMAEPIMIALTRKGIGRQESHEIVRKCAMEAHAKNKNLKDVLAQHKTIKKALSKKELNDAFDPMKYLGSSKEIIEEVIRTVGL
jgi:adenylosuccinate lyase